MPIRINLLAEAQAAEEERRKDPVKLAIWLTGFLVFLVLLWAMTLQFKLMASKSELNQAQVKWTSIEKGYQLAVENQRKFMDAEQKLAALDRLTTNRFLWGTALNAFQQTLNGVDDVQVVRFKTEQTYTLTEEIKARTNGTSVVAGRPATAIEKISMTIEAMDSSRQPGSQVSKFKDSIAQVPYFHTSLQQTNGVLLTSLSAPQAGGLGRNAFVLFTLQCSFPEKVR
jgi:hypothetical protein